MLVSRKHTRGDIVSFKLVNGDEMIAKMEEETGSHYLLSRPTMVLPSQQGLKLMQAMFTGDPTKEYELSKEHVMLHTSTIDEIARHYLETVTGIATVPKGSIIT